MKTQKYKMYRIRQKKNTLVLINSEYWMHDGRCLPHFGAIRAAAQHFSLFCLRISLTGLVADEHRAARSIMEKLYRAGTRVPELSNCYASMHLDCFSTRMQHSWFYTNFTCVKNASFWETAILWIPFYQCFVKNLKYWAWFFFNGNLTVENQFVCTWIFQTHELK